MDINSAWESTCKVLLGDGIGEMDKYEAYLRRYVDPLDEKPSYLSGKKVAISSADICPGARFISHDEISRYSANPANFALDINEIKDVDSLVGALGERACYCGNIVLGNSGNVERSNRCINAFHVRDSQDVYDSKYVAYSCTLRYSECIFGSNSIGETKFGIKDFETYQDSRCMETVRTYNSSDCYFTANVEACNNCMFSFNLRSKSRMIGNNQLTEDAYSRLKGKLLAEVRDTLRAKKTIPGIVDIMRD